MLNEMKSSSAGDENFTLPTQNQTQPAQNLNQTQIPENPPIPNQNLNQAIPINSNPEKPKRKIPFLKVFIFGFVIIITILAFSIITYILMGKNQNESQDQKVTTSISDSVKKPPADWKEYKDDEYKISFFYPPNLATNKEVHDPIGAEIFVFDPKIGTKSGVLADILIYDEYFANYLPEYITFDSFYASSSGSLFTINSEVFGNYKLTKESNFDLIGKKAFYYSRTPLPLDSKNPGTGKGAYVKINNESILVIESPEIKINDLKEILSTFKFSN